MHNYSCLDSLHNPGGVVKSIRQDSLSGLALMSSIPGPGTLLRAERTPGAVAVSGVDRGEPGEGKNSPGIPKTNSKAVVNSDGFFIGGAGKVASTRVAPSTEERQGLQQE
ncbi:hypothetical protein ES705_36497 [subsurface metagenome]